MNSESVLPVLAELFVKSVLISLGAILLARAWRGATPAQRHLLWLVTLATVVLLPATRLIAPRWSIPLQPAKKVTVTLPAESLAVATSYDPAPTEDIVLVPKRDSTPLDWRKLLLGVWITGAVVLLGYRLAGTWRLHRLWRRSAPIDDPRLRLLLSRALSELGVHRRPALRFSDECRVPITWGEFRPVMLLPRHALEWSDGWLLAALRHEGAHIRHHDYLTRWVAHVACAIYWPNPCIWLATRSLRLAQEQAADDLVLRAGTPADQYATQLVDAARLVAMHGFLARQAVAMACPSTLEDRVRAIIDGRRERRPLSRLAAIFGSSVALFVLALCAVAQLQGAEEKASPPPAQPAGKTPKPEVEISANTTDETKLAAGRIIIPKLEFRDATLAEAVVILQQKVAEVSGDKTAISIVANPSPDAASARITISLTQVPLDEAVKYIAELANQKWDYTPGVIVIGTKPAEGAPLAPAAPAESPVQKKALDIVLPKFEIREATLAEAIALLGKQCAAFDPEKTGIEIRYVPGNGPKSATDINPEDARITVNLTNIPVAEALRYVAGLANLEAVYTPTAVELRPAKPAAAEANPLLPVLPAATTGLLTKEWKIEPDYIPPKPGGDGKERVPAKDWLISRGVVFDGAATAVFMPATGRLLVRNTPTQIDLVDHIIETAMNTRGPININGGTLQLNMGTDRPTKVSEGTLDLKGTAAITAAPNSTKPSDEPVNIQADSAQFDQRRGMATYAGHVRMTWGQYTVTADSMVYDLNKKTALLNGKAEITSDVNIIQADDVEIGLLENGRISIKGSHKTIIRTPPSANEKRVDDLTFKEFGALLQGEQLAADGKSTLAQGKLREAKEALAQLKVSDAALEQRLDQLRQRLAETKGASSPAESNPSPAAGNTTKPLLIGRVLAVNLTYNFVILSIGERQGVTARSTFNVVRGNEIVARVRVTSAEPSTSVADVLPEVVLKGATVRPGDIVLPEGVDFTALAPGTRAPLLSAAPLSRNSDPGGTFVTAYMAMQKSEKLEADGRISEATKAMEEAIEILKQVREKYPEWQPQIIDFRMKRMEEGLGRLRRALPR